MDDYNMTNSTNNISWDYMFSAEVSSWVVAVKLMRSICVPFIVGVGLFGNTLCFMVFLTKNMRKSSCSAFLASLAFVDNSFLVCLLLTWIDSDIQTIMTTDFSCQILIFMTYTTSFLNAWFIVGFTFERFLAICHPLKSTYLCSVFREKVAVSTFCVSACVMYCFSFWATGLVEWGPNRKCSHKVEYFDFLSVVIWIDTFLTMLIPFGVILCINSLVLRTVIRGTVTAKQTMLTKVRNSEVEATLINSNCANGVARHHVRLTGVLRSMSQLRVARTLFVVSLIFIFLNLPSHAIRLYNLIDTTKFQHQAVSIEFYFFQELTLMLYYMTFSCNFVLYTLFGRNFKNSLLHLICCKSSTKTHKQKMLEKLTSSRGKHVTNI